MFLLNRISEVNSLAWKTWLLPQHLFVAWW